MAYAALYAVRNAPAFALAAAPPTAVALASVWKEAPGLVPIRKLAVGSAARLAGAGALALTLALLLASQFPRAAPRSWAVDTIDYHSFPIKGAQLLAEGNWPGPLYNDYNWGGYLIWSLYPARKVFIDGRAEIYYSTGTLDDDIRIHNVAPGWHEALDRRGVQVDRKSTRLNSSHVTNLVCRLLLEKKKKNPQPDVPYLRSADARMVPAVAFRLAHFFFF